jgi:hypothetical protein
VTPRPHAAAVRVFGAVLTLCFTGSTARSDVAKPVRFDPADPPATMHFNWSEPVDGIRAGLFCNDPVVRTGQPLILTIKLQNCGTGTRPVSLPIVRSLVVGADQITEANAVPGRAGDLIVTAEPLDGAGPVRFVPQTPRRTGFTTYPVGPGKLILITLTAAPSPGPLQRPLFARGGGNAAIRAHEMTTFPGLNRPGRYRLTASFSTADPADDPLQLQLQPMGDRSNLWVGRVESPPVDIEVVGG